MASDTHAMQCMLCFLWSAC